MSEVTAAGGRTWAIAALVLYGAILVTAPLTFLSSTFLVPVPVVFTGIAWRRDAPSRARSVATWISVVFLVLALVLLVYHLAWGDLS